MNRKPPMRALDETDIKLISELETNPRKLNHELAATLGISPTTVGRRLSRLLNEQIIRITVMPDPFALGSEHAIIGINVQEDTVDRVANELAVCSDVLTISRSNGSYDIIAWVVYDGKEDLLNFAAKGLGQTPGLANAEIMPVLRTVRSDFTLFTHADDRLRPRKQLSNLSINPQDVALIKQLEQNARQTVKDTALILGISRPTLRRRLQRLIDEDIIRLTTIADPSMLGFSMSGAVMIVVHPRKTIEVAETLATYDRIQAVTITTGRYNIVAWAVFRDHQDLSSFVRNELTVLSGITSSEVMISLRIAKASFALLSRRDADSVQPTP